MSIALNFRIARLSGTISCERSIRLTLLSWKNAVDLELRTASIEDVSFARNLYFETMRWIIERISGWDLAREEQNFALFFKLDEVRIITANGTDVGWIQEQVDAANRAQPRRIDRG